MPLKGEGIRRWIPAGTMLAVSLISYIDRNTLALLAPTILRETGLTGEQYGFIISAFSVAYMLANPVWGKILDRAGLPRGMTVAVSCWTVASVAHAFAGGLWSFAAARAALGFGEGATFPAFEDVYPNDGAILPSCHPRRPPQTDQVCGRTSCLDTSRGS
jgi:ACS family hexuronate transporter-like MFS transporter